MGAAGNGSPVPCHRRCNSTIVDNADKTNQMASSSEIMTHILSKGIPSEQPLTYSFLAPNTKGFDVAKAILDQHSDSFLPFPPPSQKSTPAKPTIEIAVFAAATESFSKANLNCSIAESLERFAPVISSAKAANLRVRAYISCVLGCPFEGTSVSPHVVADLSVSLLEAGADEISLGDTTGMGTAPKTRDLLECLRSAGLRNEDIAMHFHDTYGQALVNTLVSLEAGVRKFDSSVGGLGGCPYSPGATGNVSTEDVVYFLESLGMRTGVDLEALAEIGEWISEEVGRPNASSVGRAVLGARRRKRSEGKAA